VLDTIIEDLPDSMFSNRSWGRGNNPKTAVHEFLAETDNFEIDSSIPSKLLITVAPDGYLVRVKTSSHG
jgi:cephalosporin hydroxylase